MMNGRLRIGFWITCLVIAAGFVSCSAQAKRMSVSEAEQTIAVADSLLQAGQVCSDSLRLSAAVRCLRPWRLIRPTSYAKACFYYGRLLRLHDHYAEAMPQLLAARHARTDDHELLGRVYSNLAYICRLEGSYPLAYDMYECSAAQFLLVPDTLRYQTACVNMAYALAEQADTAGVTAILNGNNLSTTDFPLVAAMRSETYAEAYMRAGDFNKALHYTYAMRAAYAQTPSVQMIRAQCFSYLGQYDSATCYAERVLQNTNHLFLRANALYILTQQDSTADLSDVRAAAAERAVTLRLIADNQGELSRAVELLQQDLHRPAAPIGLWAGALCCIGILVVAAFWSIQRYHRHSVRQIEVMQQQFMAHRQQVKLEVMQNIAALQHSANWRQTLCWKDYDQLCAVLNKQFYLLADKLQAAATLNEKEVRLCVLVLMDCFDSRQMADILCYGESGIRNFKQHTANKLGTNSRQLREHLMKMIIGELE